MEDKKTVEFGPEILQIFCRRQRSITHHMECRCAGPVATHT